MKPRRSSAPLRFAVLSAIFAAASLGASGCFLWPWHHEGPTPQQQFVDALSRGNSAQASQIWLSMSPDDRQKWALGQGVKPESSPDQVKNKVMQHYQDQMRAGQDGETIEQVTPNVSDGGLQSLPSLVAPGNSPSAPPSDENGDN